MILDPLESFINDPESDKSSPTELIFHFLQVAPLVYCLVGGCWKWLTVPNTIWLVILLTILFALHILQRKRPNLTALPTSKRLIQGTKLYIFFVVLLTAVLTFLRQEGAAAVETALDKKIMRDGVVFYIDETALALAERRSRTGPVVSFLPKGQSAQESIQALFRGYDDDESDEDKGNDKKSHLFIAKLQLPLSQPLPLIAPSPVPNIQLLCRLSGGSFRKWCIEAVLDAIGTVLGQAIMLSAVGIILVGVLSTVTFAMLEQLQKTGSLRPPDPSGL